MTAQITTQGRTASAFYRSYNISNHMQISRAMAPNFHPQHQKTLADNARAFYKKSGLGA